MPIQPFVINREKEGVQHKMYRVFLYTLMIFYEFINIRTAKYDGELNSLHAFDNIEYHYPNYFHHINCKLSVFYYSRYMNTFWL